MLGKTAKDSIYNRQPTIFTLLPKVGSWSVLYNSPVILISELFPNIKILYLSSKILCLSSDFELWGSSQCLSSICVRSSNGRSNIHKIYGMKTSKQRLSERSKRNNIRQDLQRHSLSLFPVPTKFSIETDESIKKLDHQQIKIRNDEERELCAWSWPRRC